MLTEATFSAFSGYIRRTHTLRATFHRYRCLSCAHLPRQASAHSDQRVLDSPASSLQRLNSAFSATSPASHPPPHTRRRDRPNADSPNHERFRARRSRSESRCDSLHQARTMWVRDGHIASSIYTFSAVSNISTWHFYYTRTHNAPGNTSASKRDALVVSPSICMLTRLLLSMQTVLAR